MTDVHVAGEFYSAFPERRINPFKPEVRKLTEDGPDHIWGYASVFDKLSRKLGGFVEKVNNRAFTRSRAEGWPDVVCRYNHNDDFVLGTVRAATCLVDFDETGLLYDVEPPRSRGDIVELCMRGDCQHSSFAFRVPDGGDDWSLTDFSYPLRTLLSVELVDVAPVINPAYPDATAAVRALDGAVNSLSHKFQAEPAEIRSLLESNMGVKLFKRSDRPSVAPPADVKATTTEVSQEEPEMTADELRAAWYEAEVRAKYDAAQMKKMMSSGAAMKNPSGDASYPIADEEDLHNAIHAVGRGSADHNAIRRHIIARAKALGLSHMLPANWSSSGHSNSHSSEAHYGFDDDEHNAAAGTSESRADADADADDAGGDSTDTTDADDEDDDDTTGTGTEAEGREMEHAVQAAGLSDNGHAVEVGLSHQRLLAQLMEKRQFDDDEDED